jgi:GH24 family phage-related lysozyme (muramidase)
MKSDKHVKLPKSELRAMEDDLRRQARRQRLKIEIEVKDNGDETVDIAWTVSDASIPETSTAPVGGRAEERVTAAAPTARPTFTGATTGSGPAPSPAAPSVSAPIPLRPAAPGGRLLETSAADDREAASISDGTVSGENSGAVPEQAVAIVIEFESFVDHVYDDGVGVATIGYGTTRYPDGRPVRFGDSNMTKETAKVCLSHDLETTVDQLSASIPHWDEMDSNRRSALISFAYNLGAHFYGSDKFTTITASLRNKRWDDVPKVMELYSNPNDPKVHKGLLRRRKDEGELWQGKGRFAKINLV